MTYPEKELFDIKYSSDEDSIISTKSYNSSGGFGFVEMINREEEYLSIYMQSGQQFTSILITMNCGEPDVSFYPSQIVQGQ